MLIALIYWGTRKATRQIGGAYWRPCLVRRPRGRATVWHPSISVIVAFFEAIGDKCKPIVAMDSSLGRVVHLLDVTLGVYIVLVLPLPFGIRIT